MPLGKYVSILIVSEPPTFDAKTVFTTNPTRSAKLMQKQGFTIHHTRRVLRDSVTVFAAAKIALDPDAVLGLRRAGETLPLND
jgi:hypothetical protein